MILLLVSSWSPGLAADALTCLGVLDGWDLDDEEVVRCGELVATVVGQDLEVTGDGRFRIARRVAKDRTISPVDPDARHGHKTAARGFDGYKGHAAVDPDSEIITDTIVTPGNAGDGSVAEDLIDDLLHPDDHDTGHDDTDTDIGDSGDDGEDGDEGSGGESVVYGDSAYGTGEFQERLDDENITSRCRTQPPVAPKGRFGKDRFRIDLDDDTVTCPNEVTVAIRRNHQGHGIAYFAGACASCPLRDECTTAAGGRSVHVGPHEAALARARQRQQDPAWQDDYRATRPKVERKLAHLMRRRHGGRRARVRGRPKVDADFTTCSPLPPTWRAWVCSGSTPHRPDGRPDRTNRASRRGVSGRDAINAAGSPSSDQQRSRRGKSTSPTATASPATAATATTTLACSTPVT